jgi:nicotinic acid mononucleotide adenylyltransferase
MKKIVLAFGRMNPITVGHEKLVNKIKSVARKEKATPALYLSHSQDKKKNPLKYEDKIRYAKKAFGNVVQQSNARTIMQVLADLDKQYDEVIVIAGSDRVDEFNNLIQKYNGKDYAYERLEVVSAGERDPDADDVSGMSGSKMRELALTGKVKEFKAGLPAKLRSSKDGADMYNKIRDWGGIKEEMTLDEVLNLQQRIKKRMVMKRIKNKIKIGRRKAKFRMANKTKLTGRAQKQARQMLRGRLAGSLGKNYKNLGLSQRAQIDKKLEGKKAVIARLAKRLMPKVKKAEMTRLSKARKTRNEGFEQLAVIESVYDVVMSENITEKVERNLMKKSEKYGVNFEELKDKYLAYKGIMNENATFDAINSELANINEDDKPNKRGDDAKGHKRPTEDGAGLTRKGAKAAGVKTAVTTPPSKLDPDGKAAKRRKSFCARMGGMKGPMKDEKGRPTRKAMSLRRWNC